MNVAFDPARPADTKFAIGQPVSRKEDPKLLRGEGRYTDDLNIAGQAYAVIVRSRNAHGHLLSIDTEAARAMPGVLGVFVQADLTAAGLTRLPTGGRQQHRDGSAMQYPDQTPLATDRVRYVGDPLAVVVAETAKQAKDAAEAVLAEVDPLPAVTTASAGVAADAPQIHATSPGNVAWDFHYGDAEKVAAAFAAAAHVTRLPIRNNRIIVAPMEPRAAIGEYEAASGRYVLRLGCQGVFGMRETLKDPLSVPIERIRVLTGNVGGSFGMKSTVYPEYICVLHAARVLGRPVKWTDERSESFLSDSHGRDHEMTVELALDAQGHFLALRCTGLGNIGAYLSNATMIPPTLNTVKNLIGVYRTPLLEVSSRVVFTNTTPVGAYRGAGRPEGNYYMERVVDRAAAEMGIDKIELRRRNHIRPDAFPHLAPTGQNYDSGEFATVLDKALELADWDGFPARRKASQARGLLRGRGIGQYLEVTAPPSNEMGGIRFEPDGTVTIVTGTLDYGQGHASPFAQILASRLGIPFERISLFQGDSDQLIAGGGTGGSKSLMASGGAIIQASDAVIEKGRKAAAELLEAAEADIEFDLRAGRGRFSVAGTDRGIDIMELAAKLHAGVGLPADMERSIDASLVGGNAPSAFPNGCHICEVEIDPETGKTDVVRYVMVNDFGVIVNPLMVEGQAHGGIVQGIGQALRESVEYDEDGQLVTGSFMDYALPRADDAPSFAFVSHPVPAKTNALGAKGCGEAGCAGSLPSVMNAVVDALSEFGITHMDMPATPPRIWQAIRAARSA